MAKRTLGDRIAEYVNSELMTHRIKIGTMLICQIKGNFGIYQTSFDLGKKGEKTGCTCPAEYWPCKHSHALAETYRIAPETFIDIEDVLKKIQNKTKSELLEIIKKMIQRAPECLSVLGIGKFESDEEDEGEG